MASLEELRELDDAGEERSYVARAIDNFLTGAPHRPGGPDLRRGQRADRPVRAVAHRLTGAALNLGADARGEAARELEKRTRSGTTGLTRPSAAAWRSR